MRYLLFVLSLALSGFVQADTLSSSTSTGSVSIQSGSSLGLPTPDPCGGALQWTGSAWRCAPMVALPPVCTGSKALQWTGRTWRCATVTASGGGTASAITGSGFDRALRDHMRRWGQGRGTVAWNGTYFRTY